eukprot:gene9307-3656_t
MSFPGGASDPTPRLDLTRSRYDLSTYWGRVQHFVSTTTPMNILASEDELYASKDLLDQYAKREEPAGTTDEQLWEAKRLYDSAFHPQNGELMWLPGRMSFCVPGNMMISGGMLTFYQSVPAVIFWQVSNQSFNAIVNYVNRNASSEVTNTQLLTSYGIATGSATGVALGLNKLVAAKPALSAGLVGRLVPFAAVASANAINIPFMRNTELTDGIQLTDYDRKVLKDKEGQPILSTAAAKQAVSQTLVSRIIMAIPGMTFPPILTHMIHKRTNIMRRFPLLEVTFQIVSCGAAIAFAMPLSMALFEQESSMKVASLDFEAKSALNKAGLKDDDSVYFNKGL